MPHDINGSELKVGDKVMVACVVRDIYEAAEYCNVTLTTVHPMFPSKDPSTINLNAKQVYKNFELDAEDFEEAEAGDREEG